MRHRPALIGVAFACALVLAAPAAAGSGMFVGAAEDAARSTDAVHATAKMTLARLAGMDAIRVTSIWAPGLSAPAEHELDVLRNVAGAAQLNGIRVIVSVYHKDQRTTPLTPKARAEFASYTAAIAREAPGIADFIVGNEPNLNLFWMPQFNRRGRTVSAAAYLRLLAETYDALKAVSPDINVIGGSVSPRGSDRARGKRPTHSPVRFIRELGRAYKRSKRDTPVMDAFAFHPYLIPSRLPPTFRFKHPKNTTIALSDYPKLIKALRQAFHRTAQPGATLPIVYDEFGYQSVIPPEKEAFYENLDTPAARDAIDEAKQAAYYAKALAIAQCQPNVTGILLFHVTDEADARAWQSGVYYADDTPKSSLPAVRDAAVRARDGALTRCRAKKRVNALSRVVFPAESSFPVANDLWQLRIQCDRPCKYVARIVPVETPFPSALALLVDAAPADVDGTLAPARRAAASIAFPRQQLPPGAYQFVVRVFETGRPGTAVTRFSQPFVVGGGGPGIPEVPGLPEVPKIPGLPGVPLPSLP